MSGPIHGLHNSVAYPARGRDIGLAKGECGSMRAGLTHRHYRHSEWHGVLQHRETLSYLALCVLITEMLSQSSVRMSITCLTSLSSLVAGGRVDCVLPAISFFQPYS